MTFAMFSAISLICVDVALPSATDVVPTDESIVQVADTVLAPAPSDETGLELVRDHDLAVPLTPVQTVAMVQDIIGDTEDAAEHPGAVLADQENEAETLPTDEESLRDEVLAFDGETDEQVVERLKEYLQNISTLQGDFTQIAPSGAVSTGEFYLRRPGLLRFQYAPPSPLLIVANGGLVYVRDEALETTDSYPVGRTPLKFLLTRNIDLESDVIVTAVDRGVDSVAVTFSSRDDETEGELSLVMSAPELSLQRWIVRDIQNGFTVVTLENVVEGERIPSRLFRAPESGGRFLDE